MKFEAHEVCRLAAALIMCAICCDSAQAQGVVDGAARVPHSAAISEGQVESSADDTLAAAIADTFSSNPELAARRYDLRAIDDEVGIAMSRTRPQAQWEVSSSYELTLPGVITQSGRSISDRLNDPNIERNNLTSQLVVDQPISTGGRARGALKTALANSAAGRETLRRAEGDLLVDLIAAYSDVRRDRRALAIRRENLRTLEATLDEVVARREAGELTRTDIAQTETQLQTAQVQLNAAEAQLEASQAAFTAIVGREPGNLAPEPDLPNLPRSADEAFAAAELKNPDLAAAIATERASGYGIDAARAEGMPALSVRGTAGTTGPALPFDRAEHDVIFTGRATLSIPLFAGGRIRSAVAQARNRQSADALRVTDARRQMTRAIVNAWNQWVTADRNVQAQELQVRSARIFYEGAFEEYREGLRSTFDVLYAQNSLNETEIGLLASKRDRYVAQAIMLRHLGELETSRLLVAGPRYSPDDYLQKVRSRSAVPWGGVIRAIDGAGAATGSRQAIKMPAAAEGASTVPADAANAPRGLLHGGAAGTSDPLRRTAGAGQWR
jgi:outer membrane protein